MAVAHEAMHEEHRLGFIQRYIFSQDHKIIGIQYMMTSLFMAVVGGVLAMLIRMELGWPGGHFGGARWLFPRGVPAPGGPEARFFSPPLPLHRSVLNFFGVTTGPSRRVRQFFISL